MGRFLPLTHLHDLILRNTLALHQRRHCDTQRLARDLRNLGDSGIRSLLAQATIRAVRIAWAKNVGA